MRTKESDNRLESLETHFKKLLNSQFEYTTDTERNFNVKHNVFDDVWCIFKVLVESDELDDRTKIIITRTIRMELLRRMSLV